MDRDLARRRLDERLSSSVVPLRPRSGWVNAIRDALGMSGRQLAERLGVSQQRVSTLERAEVDGAVTLASLREAADALRCDLRYVLVPRMPLSEQVMERARELAQREADMLDTTMGLEDQLVERRRAVEWVERRAVELVDSRRLWDRP